MVLGCGIPYVDMKGTEEDWIKLGQKVKTLRKTLEPIHRAIGLDGWWGRVRIEFLLDLGFRSKLNIYSKKIIVFCE